MANAGLVPTLLRTQYRCHPRISSLSNLSFYGGQLRDGVSSTGALNGLGGDFVLWLPSTSSRLVNTLTSAFFFCGVVVLIVVSDRPSLVDGLPPLTFYDAKLGVEKVGNLCLSCRGGCSGDRHNFLSRCGHSPGGVEHSREAGRATTSTRRK